MEERTERTTLASQPGEGDASAEKRLLFCRGRNSNKTKANQKRVFIQKKRKMGLSRDDKEVCGP